MKNEIFTFLVTSGGLIIGWTLNELGAFFKTYRENKKVLSQILHIQLEIIDVIVKTDIDKLELQLKSVLLKKFPDSDKTEVMEVLISPLSGFLQNELNNRFSNNIQDLIICYENNIKLLSQIDPFMAYYIGNKGIAIDYLKFTNEYLQSVTTYLDKPTLIQGNQIQEHKKEENFDGLFKRMRAKITPLVRQSALDSMDKDSKLVSKKIGFITHVKTKKFIKKAIENKILSKDLFKIEAYVDSILVEVIKK